MRTTSLKVDGDEVGEGTALTCKEELVHADITQQPSAEELCEQLSVCLNMMIARSGYERNISVSEVFEGTFDR